MAFEYRDKRRQPTERRDPKYATISPMYTSPGRPMIVDWNAENAIRYGYESQLYVYKCTRKIVDDITKLPIRAGADPDKPGDYRANSPLVKLLGQLPGRPNPEMTAKTLLGHSIAMYLITGRFGWELDRAGSQTGAPIGLWPIPAHLINPNPVDGGARYFDGYTINVKGMERTLTADEMLYAWRPSLRDPRQPESVIEAARLNIDVAAMLDQYSAAFLRNSATPASLVISQPWATPEDRDQFQGQFNASYGGAANAGRTAFAEANGDGENGVSALVDIKQLGISQKDAQFQQQYEQKISDICVAFGVPLSKIGDASGRTFSNADQEDENYWEGLLPLISEIQDHLNLRLAPMYGSDVCWFDTSDVKALKPHRNIIPIDVVTLKNNEIVTNEEAREWIGLTGTNPELEKDVDSPANVGLVTALVAAVAAGVITETEAREKLGWSGDAPGLPEKPAPIILPPAPGVPPALPQAEPDPEADPTAADGTEPVDPQRSMPKVDHDRAIDLLAYSYANNTRRLMDKQTAAVQRWIAGKRGDQAIRQAAESDVRVTLYDQEYWRAETQEWAADMYENALSMAAQGMALVGRSDLEDIQVRAFVAERSAALAVRLTEEVADVVRTAFYDAVNNAADKDDIVATTVARMREYGTEFTRAVAEKESRNAYTAAVVLLGELDRRRAGVLLLEVAAGRLDLDKAFAAIGGN